MTFGKLVKYIREKNVNLIGELMLGDSPLY